MMAPLDKLHGFYQPAPPTWAPQTVGWYCLFSLIAIAAIWVLIYEIRRWLFSRYRRVALKELPTLPVNELSALLKRTALSAWPREKVASLSGAEWTRFLDGTLRGGGFLDAPGNRIEDLAFHSVVIAAEEETQLRKLAAKWIRRHRVRA